MLFFFRRRVVNYYAFVCTYRRLGIPCDKKEHVRFFYNPVPGRRFISYVSPVSYCFVDVRSRETLSVVVSVRPSALTRCSSEPTVYAISRTFTSSWPIDFSLTLERHPTYNRMCWVLSSAYIVRQVRSVERSIIIRSVPGPYWTAVAASFIRALTRWKLSRARCSLSTLRSDKHGRSTNSPRSNQSGRNFVLFFLFIEIRAYQIVSIIIICLDTFKCKYFLSASR